MKIVSIHFKNINSLKGEHAVYFDQQPLSDCGIFAITGPTGAGKSTLLDVITLALFNQVPRFSGKISRNGLLKNGSLITHNTKDAYAKIVYRIKSEEYTSVWSIAYNSKGNLNDYNMTLFQHDGVPFDMNKSNVPNKNEALIGLNYQQFVKSIMLSQGEFARFLKANSNERGKLLEDITGTQIYRNLGKYCFEIHKELNADLDEKQRAWEAIQTLDKDALRQLRTAYSNSKEKHQMANKALLEIQNVRHIKQSIVQHNKALKEALSQQIELVDDMKAFEPKAEQLQQHQQLSALAVDFNNYKQAKTAIVKADAELAGLHNQQVDSENKLKAIFEKAIALTGKTLNTDNFLATLVDFEKEVLVLDNALNLLVEKGGIERQNINKKVKAQALDINPAIKPSEAILQLDNASNNYKKSLQKYGIESLDKATINQLNSTLVKLRSNLMFFQELSVLVQQKDKNTTELQMQLKKQQEISGNIQNNLPLMDAKYKVKKLIEDKILLLQSQKENALKMASMDMHRASLKPGDACPLCGSEEHPYLHQLPKDDLNKFEIELKESQLDLKDVAQTLETLRTQQIAWDNTIQVLGKQHEILQQEQDKLLDSLRQKKDQYTGENPLPENIDKDYLQSLNTQIEEKEKAVALLQTIDFNKALKEDFVNLQAILTEYQSLFQKRQSIYKGNNLQQECLELNLGFNSIQLDLNSIRTALQQQLQLKNENKNLLQSLQLKLNNDIKEYGLNAIEDLSNLLLTSEQVELISTQKEAFVVRKTKLETQIKSHKDQLKAQRSKDTFTTQSLEQVMLQENELSEKSKSLAASIGGFKAQLDRDKADKQLVEQLKASSEPLIKKVAKWKKLNQLIGDGSGNKFSNFAQTLTLQNLLMYANKRIQKLTDRYLIVPPEKDGSLRILDQYHGNISRSVSTLSGGETFLVSLALALSLSDMASKTVSIDSLFIDEGFSTLDSEAQQMALDTLDNLQSVSQKTIGVISHVEALKSRIQVQIQLRKNAQGYSSLEIIDGSE